MFASRKRVETLVGGGARHTRTHRSRIIHEDVRLHPFLLRGARLRQGTSLARVHGARAKPDRRDGRNAGAFDAEFSWRLRPGERGERTRRPAFARTRSTRVVRVRGIVRSNARIPHRGAPGHLLYAPIRATPDATQTLLSGFGGPRPSGCAFSSFQGDARRRRTTNDERRTTLTSFPLLLLLLRTGRRAQDLCSRARPPLRRGERRFEREGPEAHRNARPRHRG